MQLTHDVPSRSVSAAGYDLPYVQAPVGRADPSVTLAIYAQAVRCADRDELRAGIRGLLDQAQALDDVVVPASEQAAALLRISRRGCRRRQPSKIRQVR